MINFVGNCKVEKSVSRTFIIQYGSSVWDHEGLRLPRSMSLPKNCLNFYFLTVCQYGLGIVGLQINLNPFQKKLLQNFKYLILLLTH